MKISFKLFGKKIELYSGITITDVPITKIENVIMPIGADDVHIRDAGNSDVDNWGTPDGKAKVVYYIHNCPVFVNIPECKSYRPLVKYPGVVTHGNREIYKTFPIELTI